MMLRESHRLPLLDGLRGIAAIMVMLHHESRAYGTTWPLPRAYLAVDFFFMLSGLVLTPALEPRLHTGLSPETFLRQRIRRLWPMLAVGALIGGIAFMPRSAADWRVFAPTLLASLLLLPWPDKTGGLYPLNFPQWSIAFELVANYVHARVLARLNDRALLGVTLLLGGLMALQTVHFGSALMGDTTRTWWGGLARVGYAYALGVWLGRRMMKGHGPMITGHWWLLVALPVPLVLGLIPFLSPDPLWSDALAVFVLLPAALWLAAHGSMPARALRWCKWLGALSYPLYAIHAPLLLMFANLTKHLPADLRLWGRMGALLAVLALATALAHSRLARPPSKALAKVA